MTKQLQDTHLFAIVPPNKTQRSQSSSPPVARTYIPLAFDALLLIGTALPLSITFHTNWNIIPAFMAQPWGNAIGPLALMTNNEDVAVGMFVDTLVDNAADWFQDLPIRCITNWDTMKQMFEEC